MKKILLGVVGIVTVAFIALFVLVTVKDYQQTKETPVLASQTAKKPPTRSELLKLVNAERKAVGADPLVIDERLNDSAQAKVEELFDEGWDSTPHTSSSGKRGLTYVYDKVPSCPVASENLLAYAYTAQAGIDEWKSSKPHYDAMINQQFDITGFAIKDGYIVQHFCDLP